MLPALLPSHYDKGLSISNHHLLRPVGKLYGKKEYVEERHRHRYEVNPKYVKDLEAQGMRFVGHSTDGQRMEIMELKGIVDLFDCVAIPWWVGPQAGGLVFGL